MRPVSAGDRATLGEQGAVTVEAAIALAALVLVVTLCIGALTAVTAQVRCVDAAREAARLAARGDRDAAVDTARRVAPDGARIDLRDADGHVTARVSVHATLLPGLDLTAEAVAAIEETSEAVGAVEDTRPR